MHLEGLNMKETNERYMWLDFARGIAMIFVIIGHSGIKGAPFKLIYIWRCFI